MNGTQLIWVVLLTFTFIVAILTSPILLITKFQNETTNSSENNTDFCPEEFTGYCMNGGYCIYLEEQQTVACGCPDLYGGKRCENFFCLPENARGNVCNKCSIGHLKRLETRKTTLTLSKKLYKR